MARTTDLTTGKLWKNLILFAIPLLLSSLVQQLYNTVDLIFVGNFIDKSASAAIGASSLLITCLVGFFGGMSVGSGVVVSHIFGARDKSGLSRAVHNAMALSLVGGILSLCGRIFSGSGISSSGQYARNASANGGILSPDLSVFAGVHVHL